MNLLQHFYRSCLGLCFLGTFFILILIVSLEANLPPVETLRDVHLQVPLKIFSADLKLIAEYGNKRRTPISLDQVPQPLIDAILATEDQRFFEHNGVDLRGILRAAYFLITQGKKAQGGSTITMQVARNFFLTRKKTYTRKLNEILLALKIEQELSKSEILELYLNKIYLGKRAHGVAAAAEVYYGKPIQDLTLAQLAMIAGLPQAPSAINPLANPKAALKRRRHVLKRMLQYGFIKQDDYQIAYDAPVTAKLHEKTISLSAPFIAEMVRQDIVERFGEQAYDLGYEVYTTIDSQAQKAATQAHFQALLEYDKRHGYRGPRAHFKIPAYNLPLEAADQTTLLEKLSDYLEIHALIPGLVLKTNSAGADVLLKNGQLVHLPFSTMKWAKRTLGDNIFGRRPKKTQEVVQIGDVIYAHKKGKNRWHFAQVPKIEGALVAMHPDSGAVLALIGGLDHRVSHFNRATQIARQPGSAFKPFVFAAALSQGYTPATVINDAPVVQESQGLQKDWRPRNYTHEFYGPTRLRMGLVKSHNLVSIRLLQSIGLDKTIEFLKNFGFKKKQLPRGLALALGSGSLSPLELAAAYSSFPNGGYQIKPYFIEKITDYQHNLIYQSEPIRPPDARRVLSPQVAYMMTSILHDAIENGTGGRARILKRHDLSGKSGSTNDHFDAWYAGYNRDLVVATWMGFDELKNIREYSVRASLPMWLYFMKKVLKDKPEHSPTQPPGLVTVRIDPKTGLLARSDQQEVLYEIFPEDHVPTQEAPIDPHQPIKPKPNSLDEAPASEFDALF